MFSNISITLTVTSAFLLLLIYRISFHPLAGIPGPRFASISGLWRSWRLLKGNWHEDVLQLHRRYGRVVRIAPNELSVVDQSINQKLYGRAAIGRKTAWYNVWVTNPAAPGTFATQDEKQHAFLRKRVAKAYSMSTILASEKAIQVLLGELIRKLEDSSDSDQVLDMSFWTALFAFDIIGKLTLGVPLGMIESAADVMDLVKNISQVFAIIPNLGHFPGQGAILNNKVSKLLMNWFGLKDAMAEFQAWSMARIRERTDLDLSNKPDDMLAHFLTMQGESTGIASLEDVLMEVMIAFGAGADTVASGMRSCLMYICTHQNVYQHVQNEVDALDSASMNFSTIQKLPYLHASIHEAMRLLPSITFPLPRRVTEDLIVNGFSIPAGTVVATSPGAQNRDIHLFGSDADCFRPHRWLDNRTLMQKAMTFGGDGPRNCIGQNLAMVEIHLFIAYMIRNFEITVCNPASPWKIRSCWIAYQKDMLVKLVRRSDQQVRVL